MYYLKNTGRATLKLQKLGVTIKPGQIVAVRDYIFLRNMDEIRKPGLFGVIKLVSYTQYKKQILNSNKPKQSKLAEEPKNENVENVSETNKSEQSEEQTQEEVEQQEEQTQEEPKQQEEQTQEEPKQQEEQTTKKKSSSRRKKSNGDKK